MMVEKIHTNPLIEYFLKFGNNIFISDHKKSLTYLQSLEVIYTFVDWFKSNNIFGKNIVLELPNSLDAQLLMFAAMMSNNVLLVNPITAVLLKDKYQASGFDVVVRSNESVINTVNDLEITFLNHNIQQTETIGNLFLYTSGTVGEAKLIQIDYDNLLGYGTTYLKWATLGHNDRLLNLVPFFHGFGITRILSVLTTGSSQYICNNVELKNLSKVGNFTWVSLVPGLVDFFNNSVNPTSVSTDLNFCTVSAAPCSVASINKFQNKFKVPLLSEYGCTEASVISSNEINKNRAGTVGIVDNTKVKIENKKIFVWPEWKTNPAWIDTGDLGFIDNDGYLTIVGREKEIIKKNGVTIYPYNLEERIQSIIGVTQAVVYPISYKNNELIGLIYVGTIDKDALVVELKQKLLGTYIPSRIDKVEQIPMVGTKVRRLEMDSYVKQLK
jgi:acyl-CoA synthetase (AMP-forming)/AMP-acid ligase II